MVLPLVDESNPKCYLCHRGFADLEGLRLHQSTEHKDHLEAHGEGKDRGPAPGDVSVF
ncbi:hypothetical protein CENSYa_1816 [Cenarchaeum symbiosum A]|uniref:C2H2-type domain-containing protein n=1 Tax=Cenarchaeum symbiosum (strain A) TaxID=414004 RepID=A0RYK9_CENSY|nr:hypothetical protein CENSYa_1816 [Cenarchaeum symbiosum A]